MKQPQVGNYALWLVTAAVALGLIGSTTPVSGQGALTWSCYPNSLDVIGGNTPRVEMTCAQAPPSGPNGRKVRRFALPLDSPMAARFAKLVNVARANGLVLNLNYDLAGANSFAGCDPGDCRRPHFFGIASQGVGPATCPIYDPYVGAQALTSFCTAACPCQVGQADCDSDSECAGDARCANDVGAGFGLPSHFDVCLPSWCVGANGSAKLGAPDCWRHEGELAAAEERCAPTLFLSGGKCQRCPLFDPSAPQSGFCTPACPCGRGEGDCDSDADCRGGGKVQKCRDDVGPQFGLPAGYDVCLAIYE